MTSWLRGVTSVAFVVLTACGPSALDTSLESLAETDCLSAWIDLSNHAEWLAAFVWPDSHYAEDAIETMESLDPNTGAAMRAIQKRGDLDAWRDSIRSMIGFAILDRFYDGYVESIDGPASEWTPIATVPAFLVTRAIRLDDWTEDIYLWETWPAPEQMRAVASLNEELSRMDRLDEPIVLCLPGRDFRPYALDLQGADLAYLTPLDMTDAILSGQNLHRVSFGEVDLSGATFDDATTTWLTIESGGSLRDADFSNATVGPMFLQSVDLTGAIFDRAKVVDVIYVYDGLCPDGAPSNAENSCAGQGIPEA